MKNNTEMKSSVRAVMTFIFIFCTGLCLSAMEQFIGVFGIIVPVSIVGALVVYDKDKRQKEQ